MKDLLTFDEYASVRTKRKEIYSKDENIRLEFVKSFVSKIVNNIDKRYELKNVKDITKSLFIKLCQVDFIFNEMYNTIEYYTKAGMAKLLDQLYPNTEQYSLYYLFRGNYGEKNIDLFTRMFERFFEIIDYSKVIFRWIAAPINDISVNYSLPIKIQQLFWQSPIKPLNEFIKEFKLLCPAFAGKGQMESLVI